MADFWVSPLQSCQGLTDSQEERLLHKCKSGRTPLMRMCLGFLPRPVGLVTPQPHSPHCASPVVGAKLPRLLSGTENLPGAYWAQSWLPEPTLRPAPPSYSLRTPPPPQPPPCYQPLTQSHRPLPQPTDPVPEAFQSP